MLGTLTDIPTTCIRKSWTCQGNPGPTCRMEMRDPLRTLSNSEKNYAQLEREALSLIYGVQKFHQYLYGRPFVLYTDHKPLTTILNSKKGIPPLSAARLQRWAVILSAYNYKIEYKSTQTHSNADGLSRLPLVVNNDKKQLAEPCKANRKFTSDSNTIEKSVTLH